MVKNGKSDLVFAELCAAGLITDSRLAVFKSGPFTIDSDPSHVRAVIHKFLKRVRNELRREAKILAVESYNRLGQAAEEPIDCGAIRPERRAPASLEEIVRIVHEFLSWRQKGWDTIALYPEDSDPRFAVLDIVDYIFVPEDEVRGADALAAKLRLDAAPPDSEPDPETEET